MTCHNCRIDTVKAGKQKDGSQRYKCQQCGQALHRTKGPLVRRRFPLAGRESPDDSRLPLRRQ